MKPQEVMRMSKDELHDYIETKLSPERPRKIRFYVPSFMYYKSNHYCSLPTAFPSISVTGSSCALKCKHCGGKVLNTMFPALTHEKLVKICTDLKSEGTLGCLISGGCLPNGSVPLHKFMKAIAKIKRDLGLTVVVHTGITDSSMTAKLKEAGVDAALIDVIGSDETIREIYQLNVRVEDYDASLRALHEAEVPVVPHILVGLHYGKLKGELHALEMISKHEPSALIIIVLMPIRGTPMENVSPPLPEDIAKVLVSAKLMMPKTPLVLGCMRPKGEHKIETDLLAIKSGVHAIAFPTNDAVQLAEDMGLEIAFSSLCCSQIFQDIKSGS